MLGSNALPLRAGDSSADTDQLQTEANAVFSRFNGTVEQRNASGVIQAWTLNGAMDQCMSEAGYPQWDWSATRNLAPRTNALGTSVFFTDPQGGSYSHALMDVVDASRLEEDLRSEELSEAETVAVQGCVKSTPPTSDDTTSQQSTPSEAVQLRSEWWSMLTALDAKYGDSEAYASCFRDRADQIATPDGDHLTADTWVMYLGSHAPAGSDTPSTTDPPSTYSSAWNAYIGLEADVESVDWACRSPVYEEHSDEVLDAVSRFAVDNAAAIAAAEDGWDTIVTRAAQLGFHGQSGSLDGQTAKN
ncbi:hypothetical protein [Nocardioides bruguierae]|uniref:hypothetical protein n=1 Tax=Nocardioides bruguierae TaxID=2945102 RepID=UPI0020216A49|nr:hypothetical protein [Nocardioides bruguierae]MCL8026975.1 hypothetical protein [Nocardioides bruguierae]